MKEAGCTPSDVSCLNELQDNILSRLKVPLKLEAEGVSK